MQPASYAIVATNEAEKAARIKVVDYRMIGATGRVYLTGPEADVRTAADAAGGAGRSGVSTPATTRCAQRPRGARRAAAGAALRGGRRTGDERQRPGMPGTSRIRGQSRWWCAPGAGAADRGGAPPLRAGGRRPSPTRPDRAGRAPHPTRGAGHRRARDLRSDADLDAFVRSLVHRFENPRDRLAIRSGRLRFRLGATAATGGAAARRAP